MAKIKLSLVAAPTFQAAVPIPVPGGAPVDVKMTFKQRGRKAFAEWLKTLSEQTDDAAIILDIVDGWDLEDEFSRESVEQLIDSYLGAPRAIVDKYIAENTQARLGN